MADATTTLEELKDVMRHFVAERDWQRFHSPKNLAMGLACEAAELMEHFLWMDLPDSYEAARDPARRQAIADEMADVANYLLCLSVVLEVDLSDAVRRKVEKNAQKYPVAKFKGTYK
jgi:NTP pyrophosphatase (non-canonical NTP hydrolase)